MTSHVTSLRPGFFNYKIKVTNKINKELSPGLVFHVVLTFILVGVFAFSDLALIYIIIRHRDDFS